MKLYEEYRLLKAGCTRGIFEVYASEEEMSLATAGRIADTVREKADAMLCLPSGSTPVTAFGMLCRMQKEGDLDLSRVRFMQLDEWLALDEDSENCLHFLDRHFYQEAGIGRDQMFCFDIHAQDMQAECSRADLYLHKFGPIDLMVLGIGMNGHLGLNEPGISWENGTTVVALSETTKTVGQKYFSGRKTLTGGITLGMKHVLASRRVILQISGAHKADIAAKLVRSEPDVLLPASALKTHDAARVLMDRASAEKTGLI